MSSVRGPFFEPKSLKYMDLIAVELAPGLATVGTEIKLIGNDSGESGSILSGYISRVDRNTPIYSQYTDFNTCYYQANASASSGSSGSPVFNVDGLAIGLQAGGISNASTDYFLPLDAPQRVLKQIQNGGEGLIVAEKVLPEGPSDGKLEAGDILIKINGKLVDQFLCLNTVLDENVGQTQARHRVPHRPSTRIIDQIVAKTISSLVRVKCYTPLALDGLSANVTSGLGLVIDTTGGYIIISRTVVPNTLCDIEVTIADSFSVPGTVKFHHPWYHYAIIQYDTNLVHPPVKSARLKKLGQGVNLSLRRLPVELQPVKIIDARAIGVSEEWIEKIQNDPADAYMFKVERTWGQLPDQFQKEDVLLSLDGNLVAKLSALEATDGKEFLDVVISRKGQQITFKAQTVLEDDFETTELSLTAMLSKIPHNTHFKMNMVEYSGNPSFVTLKKNERFFPLTVWSRDPSESKGWKRITYENGIAAAGEGHHGLSM
ncbi:hypothetical protein FOXG_14194 [Fusarium oxysporum f. sp. lycopersici 4287]|uniref:PDZ-like domain-containing protein n=2 Tax=Fusarium oxysporum TaxID=5507 RepID=A0A0J9VZ90_FUSO4|nr:hypothetical protein FOXG_14194 [Fusarium oxysporum f. sp. lycopersici 4287]KNB15820.1 hypothetical protein FOXG_14194 [Fusarium oxysporum f. sp. lycopersici 4287]